MNALIKKEVRLLLPSFVFGLVLAFSPLFIQDDKNPTSNFRVFLAVFPFLICPAVLLMMTLDSFGREISAGTFSNLLSQPISRRKIWRTKTVLLGIAVVIVWGIWWVSLISNKDFLMQPKEMFVSTIFLPLVIYSGGLWTVLLLRQVAAAFWFTVIIPAALVLVTMSVAEKIHLGNPAIAAVLSIYSVAGFIFARWLFLRAQDVQWTGGNIALPEFFNRTKGKTNSCAERTWRPRAALFFKELQLHQSQLIMAGALTLLHLAVIVVRKFGDFKNSPATEFVLGQFWVLWFAMPLLVGCAAVAEERKLGTLESQLCLPVRRRTQFWIKFVSAMSLAFFLALAMPLLLEGTRIFPEIHSNWDSITSAMPVLFLIGIAAVIAAVSFYASTLSRNTLQSLAPAVLGILVTFMMFVVSAEAQRIFPFPLWRGWLIYLIGVPVMTLTLIGLMYWNFKHVFVGWKTWGRNVVVFSVSLLCVVGTTTVIYHRVWELLTPHEPAHGAARIAKFPATRIQPLGNVITIQLPDGKIWSNWLIFRGLGIVASKIEAARFGEHFFEGTNWDSLSTTSSDAIGIQRDGSLWVSEKPSRRVVPVHQSEQFSVPKLTRFGTDTDWKSIVGYPSHLFLLKTDRTIWRWGTNRMDRRNDWPGLSAFKPHQLGTNSDWAEISQTEYTIVFRKADGQTWIQSSAYDTNSIKLDEEIFISRAERFDDLKSTARLGTSLGLFEVGVSDDGNFFAIRNQWTNPTLFNRSKERVQLGKESDWQAVAGQGEAVVTLKADGSLWKWKLTDDPLTHPDSASAVRLSKHSDWIAIAEEFGGVVCLAADGSLWLWQFDSRYFSQSEIHPLLGASRKPQKIGNIFDAPRTP